MSAPEPALLPKPSIRRALAGLGQVFLSPEHVFPLVGKQISWPIPLIATVLLGLVTTAVILNIVGMETIMRNELEANPRMVESLGQAKIDEMVAEAASPGRAAMAYIMGPLGGAVSLLFVAGVLFGMVSLGGGDARYASVLAVCAYAYFAYAAVNLIASVIALKSLNDYAGLDIRNLLPLNPGFFIDRASSKVLHAAASSFDLLVFWLIFLLALGLSRIVSGLKLSKALALVILPWLAWVAGKTAFAALF